MTEALVIVPGVPSTDHRPRASVRHGKIRMSQSPEYEQWKARVRLAGLSQRPTGWRLDRRYAVEVIGYLTAERADADNLRGALDALQGVLWTNDRQCRPVIYHYLVDKSAPRVEVRAVPYDPKREGAGITIEIGRVA